MLSIQKYSFSQLSTVILSLSIFSTLIPSSAIAKDIFDRGAQGEITEQGGARRIAGYNTISAIQNLIQTQNAKNVILLIGDGMGDAEITIARNYAKGASGYFEGIDSLPFTGNVTTYALILNDHAINHVIDSAASGTAWATGVKSYNGAIGVDVTGKAHPNLIEIAKAAGLATGNVSTAEIQDATPAVMLAHVTARKCYGPETTSKSCPNNALENNGAGSITEQFLASPPDVVFGGGLTTFSEIAKAGDYQGITLLAQAQQRGYQIVYDLRQMNALNNDTKKPVIGLFSAGNMPVRWLGPKAVQYSNLNDEPISCQINPARTADIPNLAEMTSKAIELLSQHDKGFFLQVEGASIDKQDHAANPCGQIGETVDLDEAVQVALNFAKQHGDTLVIVTADHAHTSQLIPNAAKAPGLTQTLKALDGSLMTISYGTSETESQEHTGTQIRIAAFGPQAVKVTGLIDQTDIFFIIKEALGLDK